MLIKYNANLILSIFLLSFAIGCTKAQNLSSLAGPTFTFGFANTATSLPQAYKNQNYTYNYATNNGNAPVGYTLSQGALPAGLTLSTGGVITGLITGVVGNYSFTVKATDSTGQTVTQAGSVSVSLPFSLLNVSLPGATVNTSYTAVLSATGGVSPYNYSATGLPAGMSIASATGIITGVPSSIGTSSVQVSVTDSAGASIALTMPITVGVSAGTLTITTSSISGGTAGSAYAAVISANGGQTPYSFVISTGALPAGLAIDPSSGVISGTPTAANSYSFTVRVTDTLSNVATQSYSVTMSHPPPPVITTNSLPVGQQQQAYSTVVLATGGSTPYVFSISAGALPAGLTISSSTGLISGVPTVSGTVNFTVLCTDAAGSTAGENYSMTLTAAPVPTITTNLLNPGSVSAGYTGFITAIGGTPPYTFAVTTGTLPTGMSLSSSTGTLYGTPTVAGTSNFKVTVTDSLSNSSTSSSLALVVNSATAPTITTSTLAVGQAQVPYGAVIAATGGTSPYTFSVSSGTLPAGLTIAGSTGLISGTPTASGTVVVTFMVTDSVGGHSTATLALTISAAATPTITTSSLPVGQQQIAYSTVILASGGQTPYTFAVNAGSLPTGLAISASTGLISGTPTGSGTSNFSVQVTDHVGSQTAANFSLTLNAAPIPSITTSSLNNGQVGTSYTAFIVASGGTPPYTFALGTGTLPAGVTLNTSAGVLFGTPTAAGTSSFKIVVTDNLGNTGTSTAYSLLINPPTAPTITTSSLAAAQAQVSYSQVIAASGGSTPYTFTISAGSLPAGLTMASGTGLISGTPTASGSFPMTFKVTDNVGSIGTANLTLAVSAAATPTISTSSLAGGQITVPYTAVISATGGHPLYTYAVTTGSLPAGLSLAASTGVISGTPTANGTTNFSITATDSASVASTSVALSITVANSPYATLAFQTASPLLPQIVGQNDSRTIEVTGGLPPYIYAVTAGSIPTGLSFSTGTGVLSGVPTATGTFTFTVQVTDARSTVVSQSYTFKVLNPLLITTTTLPPCIQNTACSIPINSSGGSTPYSYTATGIPAGLAMSSAGIISGNAPSTGTSIVLVTVTDANNLTASASYSVVVVAGLSISTATVSSAAILRAYSQTIATTGGVAPYTFTQTSGTLPNGLTLSSAGVISGTPAKGANARIGSFTFAVQVADSSGLTASKSYTMTVSVPPTVQDDISNKLRVGAVGVPYSDWVRETGGAGSLVYSASGLPSGLSINATNGAITGTPSGSAGTTAVSVKVTDANGMSQTRSKNITIVSAGKTAGFDGGFMNSYAAGTLAFTVDDSIQGDFNNDGKLDLIVAGQNNKLVLFYSGNGDGTYAQPTSFTAANNIQNILLVDLDGDGKLDLLISETNMIEILKGDNSWATPNTMTKQQIITNLSNNSQVALGDLNGDTKIDFVAANSGTNTYAVFMNCQAAATVSYNAGTPACTAGGIINYYAPATIAATGTNVIGVGLTDLNGDGKLDLVGTSYNTRTVSTWLGNGNGTFAGAATSTSSVFPYSLGWVRTTVEPATGWTNTYINSAANLIDINKDGIKDVVIQANQGSYILLGGGTGSFVQTLSADVSDLGAGVFTKVMDINGDGNLDLVSEVTTGGIANIVNPNGAAGSGTSALWGIQLFFGNGSGSVSNRQVIPGGYWGTFALGNFVTATTRPNLAEARNWSGQYPSVAVRANNLTSTAYNFGQFQFAYQSVGNLFYDFSFSSLAIGDLNGDGVPDFIAKYNSTGSGNAVVFVGNQTSGWNFTSQSSNIPTGDMGAQWWNGRQSVLTDIDGDGILDYADANWNNAAFSSVGYALGNGDTTFGSLNYISTDASGCTSSLGAESITFADFNHDGKMDMAIGQGCNGAGTIVVYYGNGDGTFNTTSPYVLNSGNGAYADLVQAFDVNGDGWMDLVAVTRNGYLMIYLNKGDGTGTFNLKTSQLAGVSTSATSLEIADINNDGIPDYVISTINYGSFVAMLGGANGTIASSSPYAGVPTYSSFNGAQARLVDWDNDGYLDVLYSKQHIGLQFFKGNGTGAFTVPTVQYSLPNPGALEYNLFGVTDVNNDGLQDMIIINGDNNMMSSVGYSVNKSH